MPAFGSRMTPEQREENRGLFPPMVHPVVRTHPESGEQILYVNEAFTTHLANYAAAFEPRVGFDFKVAEMELLSYLLRQATIPEYQMRLRWEPDTLVDLGQPLDPALRHPGLLPGRPPHDARHRHRRPPPLTACTNEGTVEWRNAPTNDPCVRTGPDGDPHRSVRDELRAIGFVPRSVLHRPPPGLVPRSTLVRHVAARKGDVVAVTAPSRVRQIGFVRKHHPLERRRRHNPLAADRHRQLPRPPSPWSTSDTTHGWKPESRRRAPHVVDRATGPVLGASRPSGW